MISRQKSFQNAVLRLLGGEAQGLQLQQLVPGDAADGRLVDELGVDVVGNTVLDVQNDAYTIACDIMAKIDNTEEYYNVLSVYDYSILTLARYTDDQSAGVKLSLTLEMPNPVNLCTLDENFNDEPYSGDTDTEITIETNDVGDLDINPIHLPINRRC